MRDEANKWLASGMMLALVMTFGSFMLGRWNASHIGGGGVAQSLAVANDIGLPRGSVVNSTQQLSTAAASGQTLSLVPPSAALSASSHVASSRNTLQASALYVQAVNTYQYRIQFSGCHGTVSAAGFGTLNVKQGERLMLDNRDPVPHTIALKGQSVKVGPSGFAVVAANAVGTYPITCDGGGAETLNVEP